MRIGSWLVLVIATLVAPALRADDVQAPVNVCSTKQSPESFVDRRLILHGRIVADGMNATLILSGTCERNGLPVRPAPSSTSPDARVLRDAVMHVGQPGTIDKDIDVTVNGVIRRLDNTRLVMDVESVKSMTITYRGKGSVVRQRGQIELPR